MRISKKELRELCKALDAWVDAAYDAGFVHGSPGTYATGESVEVSSKFGAAYTPVLKLLGLTYSEFVDLASPPTLKLDCKCRVTNCGRRMVVFKKPRLYGEVCGENADGRTVVWVNAIELLAWLAAAGFVKVETAP